MLIRSTDSDAPTLSGETGKLYDVLKWALPQIGWSIEFDNGTDVIVFRNDPAAGTGDYLRIDDNFANHAGENGKTANVTSFSGMSDIDTGTDQVGDGTWLVMKSVSADSTARPWAVVGDGLSFWLLISSASNDKYSELYFGDIESDKPSDAGRFLTQAILTTNPESNSFAVPFTAYGSSTHSDAVSQLRFNLGVDEIGIATQYQRENRSGSTSPGAAEPGAEGSYPEPASGGVRVIDITVQESSGGAIRGRLRGSVQILNNVVGVFQNFDVIANQETARGQRDITVVNWQDRATFTDDGVIAFDTGHTGAW